MPAERAGYTVTMFLVDVSSSMGKLRTVELPPGPNGEQRTTEMSNLEWSLQFVKLKIQEMIYNGRKTDQCGVIVFGSEDTDNIINERDGGYEHVTQYIPIAQPNAGTLAKLDMLEPSELIGDPIDALIVGIETQADYLATKKTWTRKIVIVTDGENPIEIEDWEATVKKMDALDVSLTVIGLDFDDDELPFHEEDKSPVKRANETFYTQLTSTLKNGIVGTCALALREIARPDIKVTKSVLMGTVLRLGDVDVRLDEAFEVAVKTSKCTALTRPKGWKKFARRVDLREGAKEADDSMDVDEDRRTIYAQLQMRTEYFIDKSLGHEDEDEMKVEEDAEEALPKADNMEKVEKEQLVRGFKYGATYAPCPEGQFPRLETRKGIDILGFFRAEDFRHELSMGEIQYVWADPGHAQQQVALSSIVQAMKGREGYTKEKELYAIARWVTKDGADPKMGVLAPSTFEKVDCLLWSQMPFADDVRKYTFASLDNLISKSGEKIAKHPYLPTEEQMEAMDRFVDSMDLMEIGEKDEEGNRTPWFDPILSYSPAVHRTKQALFHCAVVSDINTNPLPPPHPELLKYFEPPKRVIKRAQASVEECMHAFKVKEVPKKVTKQRKDGHVRAQDDDDDMLLLDAMKPKASESFTQTSGPSSQKPSQPRDKAIRRTANADDSDTEPESDGEPSRKIPTTSRSTSPPSAGVNSGHAPGRIIGSTYPLADFQKNLARGDLVSKAVEDLGWVIREIIGRPFGMGRSEELITCIKALRDTALKEDEIEAWNEFMPALRQTCKESNILEFWTQVAKHGKKFSLISNVEAKKYGGVSDVTESQAEEFFSA